MCGYVSKSIKSGLNKRNKNAAAARANAGGEYQVFQVKRNGDNYTKPHALGNQTQFTKAAAEAEALRMGRLNPGKEFVVV